MIIAFAKHERHATVAGLPVIAIFNVCGYRAVGDFDYEAKRLTTYFRDLVSHCEGAVVSLLEPTRHDVEEER